MDLSHILQLQLRPGIIDLGWGHPDLSKLPVDVIRVAADAALQRYGGAMLTYGIDHGVAPLRESLCEWIGRHEPRQPALSEIMLSAGNSQALSLIVGLLAQPGDVVFVENPTYHLALRILRDAPVQLVPIACDTDGLVVAALAEALSALNGRRAAFLYTIPTFQNPTGTTMSLARRKELLALVNQYQLRIVEDDVYRELWYDAPPPPSLWSTFPNGSVIRLGSLAKSLAPGLRLGFITADTTTIQQLAGCGLLDSGGGIAHFQSLLVAELFARGGYADIVSGYRTLYAARRNALHQALLPLHVAGYSWVMPAGGYFLWMRLPHADLQAQVLERIRAQAVDVLPSTLFVQGDLGYAAVRLAFSLYDEAQLTEAATRIVHALR